MDEYKSSTSYYLLIFFVYLCIIKPTQCSKSSKEPLESQREAGRQNYLLEETDVQSKIETLAKTVKFLCL